jgi:hypothetical protein
MRTARRVEASAELPSVTPLTRRRPVNRNEERESRVTEMLVLARKHQAKASLRAVHVTHLERMLAQMQRDHSELAAKDVARAGHLADAIVDLTVIIARERSDPDGTC